MQPTRNAVSIRRVIEGQLPDIVLPQTLLRPLFPPFKQFPESVFMQQPALLLGIALGISFNMGKNSIFFWEWNPECLDSHWKNRLFKN